VPATTDDRTTLTRGRQQLHHQHQDQVRNYVTAPLGN
jgi:hypothetical protein